MNASNSWKLITALVLIVLVSVAVAAWALGSSHNNGDTEKDTGITVADTAEVKGKPDTAYVTFGVATSNRIAALAAEQNAEKTDKVIKALVEAGISKSDIKTDDYSFYPQMDYDKDPPKVVGYRASNQVKVTTKDMAKVGKIIDTGIKSGATAVDGVKFDIRDKDGLRRKALSEAVKKSHKKAQAIAEAMGAELGRAKSASESVESTAYKLSPGLNKMMAYDADGRADTAIIPEDVKVTAEVSIIYDIR